MKNYLKKLWKAALVGVLFASIPFLPMVLGWIDSILGVPADTLQFSYFNIYAPVASFGSALLFWFIVGDVLALVTLLLAPRRFIPITLILFIFGIIYSGIIPMWWKEFQHSKRNLGIGYSIEDCRKMDPTLYHGYDRPSCVTSVAIRMINDEDIKVNAGFCNDLIEDSHTMEYCWSMLGIWKESTKICDEAKNNGARNSCIVGVAMKLIDEEVCKAIVAPDQPARIQACIDAVRWERQTR